MPTPAAREISGTTMCLITRYVRDRAGEPGVARLLDVAGDPRTPAEIDDEHRWSTYEQMTALLDAAAVVLDDPEVCLHIGEAALEGEVGPLLRVGLRRLGSPRTVLANIATANSKFTNVATMTAESLERDHAVITYRLDAAKTPHRGDCQLNTGLMRTIGPLFGMPPLTIEHPECQVDGAPACRYLVSWPAVRRGRRRRNRGDPMPLAESSALDQIAALEAQIEQLQSITADLVSSDDVDEVLTRIVGRAGKAVSATRFLLARYDTVGVGSTVYADGIAAEDQAGLARKILAADLGPAADQIVIEVASSRRAYGRLAAFYDGKTYFPFEARLLAAYARSAAAALDAATALDASRRHAAATEALLGLARALAEPASPRRIARTVASATIEILDVEATLVMLWNDDRAALFVAGRSGWPLESAHVIDGYESAAATVAGLFSRFAGDGSIVVPIRDAAIDHPGDPLIAELARLDVAALAIAPIQARQGELYGLAVVALDALDAAEARRVGDGLVAVADQTAIALQNAALVEQIRHQAVHDGLTSLANRALFDEDLTKALARAGRDQTQLSVLFIDLDDFKAVNDRFGHGAGDHVLRTVADRLAASGRQGDSIARLGGDEFTVLVSGAGRADAERVADRIADLLREPIEVGDVELRVNASIGVASFPEDATGPDAVMRDADRAMYRAKRSGRRPLEVAASTQAAGHEAPYPG